MSLLNEKERSAAWNIDKLDPDNWIRIPEFGINPKDVDYKGFVFPIVLPISRGYGLRCIVREHVKTARTLMRKEGRSLSDVQTDCFKMLDMIKNKSVFEKLRFSRNERMASIYALCLHYAKLANKLSTDENSSSREQCCEAITQCAKGIRNLAIVSIDTIVEKDGFSNPESTLYLESERKKLSKAGKLGASAMHKDTDSLKIWALEKSKSMHGSDMDNSRKLAKQLPENLIDASEDPQRLIYDAIRKAAKRK